MRGTIRRQPPYRPVFRTYSAASSAPPSDSDRDSSTTSTPASTPLSPPYSTVLAINPIDKGFLPLLVTHESHEHIFSMPIDLHFRASQLIHSLGTKEASDSHGKQTWLDGCQSSEELVLRVASSLVATIDNSVSPVGKRILYQVLDEFKHHYLRNQDIHTLVAKLPGSAQTRLDAIKAFYAAVTCVDYPVRTPRPALLRSRRAKLVGIFGGQGNTKGYFEELRETFYTYRPLIEPLIGTLSDVLVALSKEPEAARMYGRGLDVTKWLLHPETTPDQDYLIFAPVSLPLIGLIQLTNYYVACKTTDSTPGDLPLCGATGHSQGIVVAAVVSAATSWTSFETLAASAVEILYWIGLCSQQSFSAPRVPPSIVRDSIDHGEGSPSPMLSVRGLTKDQLQAHIQNTNSYLPESLRVELSLVNGPRNLIVSGPSLSLHGLNIRLRRIKAPKDLDQSRVPYKKRKVAFDHHFLPVTVPFHSKYTKAAIHKLDEHLQNIQIMSSSLRFPVWDTCTGQDLRQDGDNNIVPSLVRLILRSTVNWDEATKFTMDTTHILDFGPGGPGGIGSLTSRNKEGCGIRVIMAAVQSSTSSSFGCKAELMATDEENIVFSSDWGRDHGPKLSKTSTGKIQVDTKLSRLLGLPPVFVPGMTPTTTNWEFVSKTMNAGYHIELAGGGYHTESEFRRALTLITNAIPAGRCITVNLIYANPRQVSWQIPLLRNLRSEGVPIEGITIGAGIPSAAIAKEYITTLGLRHISFKPGSVVAIQCVIDIAQNNPHLPIVLQWTGGRGGGHHSFEDFHEPILEMYGKIRKEKNIILVAGSGFGGADDTYTYLTGAWSHKYGRTAVMPFDGFLVGSRVMVAAEAQTSLGAKQAIIAMAGLSDEEWESTCQGRQGAGGVVSVISEMGEPIHMLATRGVQLWAELDERIFSLPREDRLAALEKDSDNIIRRLNADFQRVWFAIDRSRNPTELGKMTYVAVANRLVELLYVERRWIHKSYQKLVWSFLVRLEQRVAEKGHKSLLDNFKDLENPHHVLQRLFRTYPIANSRLLTRQDVEYFLQLCHSPGQKPPTFIPVIDENFETYFKKDSLWQSEDLAAVVDQDAGRTCILQGPLAVKYSKIVDEPIRDILGQIVGGHVKALIRDLYQGKPQNIPFSGQSEAEEKTQDTPEDNIQGLEIQYGIDQISYRLPCSEDIPLPSLGAWLALLAGQKRSWRTALLLSDPIVSDQTIRSNAIRAILNPTRGLLAVIKHYRDVTQTVLQVKEYTDADEDVLVFEANLADQNHIQVKLFHDNTCLGHSVPLSLFFSYHPDHSFAPIQESLESRRAQVKAFFWKTWFGNERLPDSSIHEIVDGGSYTIPASDVDEYVRATRPAEDVYVEDHQQKPSAVPLRFAIVLAWKAIIKPLFSIDADLLTLVHLSNTFEMVPNAEPLQIGNHVSSSAKISSVKIHDSGKEIMVNGTIFHKGQPVIKVVSKFLYRGSWTDFQNAFEHTNGETMQISSVSETALAILKSKTWFKPSPEMPIHNMVGHTLDFRFTNYVSWKDRTSFARVKTTGTVLAHLPTKEAVQIGEIDFHHEGGSSGNPVITYLERFGNSERVVVALDRPVAIHGSRPLVFEMPGSNEPYAQASGDFNPIHLSPMFTRFTSLPGTISHGMHTSATVQALLESHAAEGKPERVTRYSASFVGMVLPGDEIHAEFLHTGMVGGRKLVRIEAKKNDGTLVLTGEAEVEQPPTAYVFTGQGSQEVGMGMVLYESSDVARAVWDRADKYFMNNYGFAISQIVRENPKELTVFFGGVSGQAIRKNYMDMFYHTKDEYGEVSNQRMFESVTPSTESYTYSSPNGLLNSTQFTQPALTLMEKARFEDMQSKGLVTGNASFAGHSLGEYGALSSLTSIMPVEKLMSIVFFRGMTMQNVIKRDPETGRTGYSMSAVNPSKVALDERSLQYIVDKIAEQTDWLLEIVNYNISDLQYVCAGSVRALDCLSAMLRVVKAGRIDIQLIMEAEKGRTQEMRKAYDDFIRDMRQYIQTIKDKAVIDLQRDTATVPLKSIEVPFHSTFLQPGVSAYREFLQGRLDKSSINLEELVGKWIPNVTGKPFGIGREEFEDVYEITGSTVLAEILQNWDRLNKNKVHKIS